VMIGEIRDPETARIAVQASLTGHLVLSTLHTNTALGAVIRLQDIGIESFLLSSSLLALASQRLVRVLCPLCKQAKTASSAEKQLLQRQDPTDVIIYAAKGCGACQNTGYNGRSGIYEFILLDDHLRQLIHDRAPEIELTRYCHAHTQSMRQDGIRRVLAGETTLEEVMRVT
jgi:general secretion pathway protein E